MTTIFTKIINKEIPSKIIFENDILIVIEDINPKAKTHLLIIPKKEIPTINDLKKEDMKIIFDMFIVAKDIAKQFNIQEWYNLKFNVWEKWWQEIMHIHLHLTSNL